MNSKDYLIISNHTLEDHPILPRLSEHQAHTCGTTVDFALQHIRENLHAGALYLIRLQGEEIVHSQPRWCSLEDLQREIAQRS